MNGKTTRKRKPLDREKRKAADRAYRARRLATHEQINLTVPIDIARAFESMCLKSSKTRVELFVAWVTDYKS